MPPPIRILHLDDDPLDAQLIEMTLENEHGNLPTALTYVQTKTEYLAALKHAEFDIILSDYRMPGFDGDDALAAAQMNCPEIPFIMVTGELGEERVIETLQRGATDYVLKDRIFRLVPAIKRALEEAELKRRHKEAARALEESEERYRAALANPTFILAQTDTQARYTWIHNPHLDMDVPSILGKRDSELDPSNEGKKLEEIKLRVLEAGKGFKGELALRKSDGLHYYEMIVEPRRDARGQLTGLTTAGVDITERKEAEEELRRREARFRSLISSSREAIALVDERGILLAISESGAKILGSRVSKLVNKDVHHFVEGAQVEAITKSLLQLHVKPDTPQFIVLRLRGEKKTNPWIELEATAIKSGRKIHAYFFRLHRIHLSE